MTARSPVVLLVEGDVIVRHPLAEYLRECGFVVFEAADGGEAMAALSSAAIQIEVVLADLTTPGGGFGLCQWIRTNKPSIEVILAGSIEKAADRAGNLCNEGPALAKPYEHRLVLDRIRQTLARRDKGRR